MSVAKRLNCERSNAPILTIRVLDAILILPRLFAGNFIFGAEATISARAEVGHVIETKFQPPNRAEISARVEIRHVIRPLKSVKFEVKKLPGGSGSSHNTEFGHLVILVL